MEILFLLFLINFINYILFTDLMTDIKVNFKLVTDFPRRNSPLSSKLNLIKGYLFVPSGFLRSININLFNNKTLITINKWDFEFMLEHFLYDIDNEYFKYPNKPLKFLIMLFELNIDGSMSKLLYDYTLEYSIAEGITPENLYDSINSNNKICRIANNSGVFIITKQILSPHTL